MMIISMNTSYHVLRTVKVRYEKRTVTTAHASFAGESRSAVQHAPVVEDSS